MTTKGIALAAAIIVFSSISGVTHAAAAMHERGNKVEPSSSLSQMQTESPDFFAGMSSPVYHGGPKSND
jgi:hypothetical protein